MKNKIFQRGSHYQSRKLAFLHNQKQLIEKHYSYLSCEIRANVLICTGWLQPDHCADRYKIKMEYVVGKEPKTTILQPIIHPHRHIHMYQDHSICLHYPPDMKWDEKIPIYQFTVPWISEWIVFYEVYKITGKWEGRESPVHIRENDKNVNIDRGD